MHFDQRTQQALRESGLDTEEIEAVSDRVAELAREDAQALESFFEGRETVFADIDMAHTDSEVVELTVEYCDLYTHADDIRGYLRFDSWGVAVEGGRVLDEGLVELTLGPTVHDRVRFAPDPDDL